MDLLLLYRGLKPGDPNHGAEVTETPLGLYSVAAAAKYRGFDVDLINTGYLSEKRENALLDSLETPVVIGLTQTTVNRHAVYYLVKKLKKRFPGTPVIIGGIHASLFTRDVLKTHPDIDYVIVGEGETPVVKLLEVLKKGEDVSRIPGLAFRKDGEIAINPQAPPVRLDSIPAPTHYFPVKYLQGTRGCPYECSYCATNAIFRDGVRTKPIQQVIAEIKVMLNVHNITHISFSDDLFFLDKKRLLDFGQAANELDFHFTFDCNLRVNMVDEEAVKILVRSGCTRVMFGIESASTKILDIYNKKINKEHIINAVRLCRKYCLQTGLSFMSCGKYDDENTFRKTVELIDYLKPTDIIANALYLYPGSRFYSEAVSDRSLDPGIWETNSTPLPLEAYAGYPDYHKMSLALVQRLDEHYRRNKSDYQYKTGELEQAWKDSRFPVIGLKLASRYINEKQFEHGARIIDTLMDMGYRTVDVVTGKAMIYLGQGLSREAMSLLTEFQQEYPASKNILLSMGSIHEHAGDVESAIDYYTRAYRFDDDPGQLLMKTGLAYEKAGKNDLALGAYRQLMEDCAIYSPNMKQFLNIKIQQLEVRK